MSRFRFNFNWQSITALLTTAIMLGTIAGVLKHHQSQREKAEFNKSSVHSVEFETRYFVSRTAGITTIQDVDGIPSEVWDKTKGNKHDNIRFAKYPDEMDIAEIIKKEQVLNPRSYIVYQSQDGIDYHYLDSELVKKVDQATGKEVKIK